MTHIIILGADCSNAVYETNNFPIQLDLVLKDEAGGDLSDFITNGEWYLIGEFISMWYVTCDVLVIRKYLAIWLSYCRSTIRYVFTSAGFRVMITIPRIIRLLKSILIQYISRRGFLEWQWNRVGTYYC